MAQSAGPKARGELEVSLNEKPFVEGANKVIDASKKMDTQVDKSTEKATKGIDKLGAAANKVGNSKGMKQLADSTATAAARMARDAKKAEDALARLNKRVADREARQAGELEIVGAKTTRDTKAAVSRRETTRQEEEEKRKTIHEREQSQIRVFNYKQEQLKKNADLRTALAERKRLFKEFEREHGSPTMAFFGEMNRGIATRNQMSGLMAGGMSGSQAWQQMMNQSIARANASNAAFFAGQNPPPPPRGPFAGGFFNRFVGGGGGGIAGSLAGGLASGLGVGLGGYGLAQGARALVASSEQATAYDRQRIAAEQLAGSQQKLNELLDAYTRASGGAINQVTTLENVTRLLATGFAETVPDVERFVRATRGASIALGRPQDYVIQETQLAISNVSQKRLDQIGLGIQEVTDKIEQLRNSNANWSREMAFQEAVLTLMDEKYGNLTETIEGQATGIEKLRKTWEDYGLTIGQTVQGPLNAMSEALLDLLNVITEANRRLVEFRNSEIRLQARFGKASGLDAARGFITGQSQAQINAQRILAEPGAFGWPTGADRGDMSLGATIAPVAGPRFSDEVLDIARKSASAMADLERKSATARLTEIQNFEESRASIIRNYGKQVVREEQDFARARARGLRDYERSILDVMRDAQEREVEMQEDLDKALADLNEDSEKRVSKINEKYHKDKERAEQKHRDNLMKAAGQLDAIAVLEERKRFAQENEEREEAHNDALAEERDSLAERTEEAMEAHQEQLDDARKADAKRLEDMRISRERQLADEDEDRRIRLDRAAEDHNDQLAELDRQHVLRMEQLARQQADEAAALQQALMDDLAAVGVYIAGYHDLMRERDALLEKWLDNFILLMELKLRDEASKLRRSKPPFLEGQEEYYSPTNPNSPEFKLPGFAKGGPVRRTGLANLHAGEYVLTPDMQARVGAAISNNWSNLQNNRNVTFQPGAISITTSPGMEFLVADMVEERVIELMGSV